MTPGIERARPRSHHQPVDRGEKHRCSNAGAPLDCAHTRAIPEMRDDQFALSAIGSQLEQYGNDIFGCICRRGRESHTGESLGWSARAVTRIARRAAVALSGRGVEAADLRHLRGGGLDGADRGAAPISATSP